MGGLIAAYSIVRIKKLKLWGAAAGAVFHNARKRETPNAPCRFLIGSPADDPVPACKDPTRQPEDTQKRRLWR